MQLAVAVRRDLFTHRAGGPWSDEHGRVLTLSPFQSSQTKYIPAADHFFQLPSPDEMHNCLCAGSRDAVGDGRGHAGRLRATLPPAPARISFATADPETLWLCLLLRRGSAMGFHGNPKACSPTPGFSKAKIFISIKRAFLPGDPAPPPPTSAEAAS